MKKNMLWRKFVSLPIVFTMALPLTSNVFSSCSKDSKRVKVDHIELKDPGIIHRGFPTKINVSVFPEDATNKDIEWSIDDNTIASIDQNGNVTGLNVGSTLIKAISLDDSRISAIILINVEEALIDEITLSGDSISHVGDTTKIKAEIKPAYAYDQSLIWSSSNPDVASVDENGTIKAKASGVTNISVFNQKSQKSQEMLFNVVSADAIGCVVGDDGAAYGFESLTSSNICASDADVSIIADGKTFPRKIFNCQILLFENKINKIPDHFLFGCHKFNKQIIIPNSVTSIGDFFLAQGWDLSQCWFDSPVIFEEESQLSAIGTHFLQGCHSFNKDIFLPEGITKIGFGFMYNCDKMLTLHIGNLMPDIFVDNEYTLATENIAASMYTDGVLIEGIHKDDFLLRFENLDGPHIFRKLK